ncbi:DUF2690 domain-containing protein [Streptomyces sp. NPDC088090]|uniref:helix-turn-helix domain-containing protein n=1 Tax=Streptomyces sp. NPDC088090 TaxID=3365822 RepID=UPI00384EF154
MPAWKALPGELDPDVRAFAERLRLVIDRSGLGVAAVAERTGPDRDEWEAYLNARGPVPRSAVVALSDVTGADLGPLTAAWEHADRAWKRLLRERAVPSGEPVRDGARAPEGVRDGGRLPGSAWGAGRAPEPVRDEGRAPGDAPAERTMRIRPVPPAPAPASASGPAPASASVPAPASASAPASAPRKRRRASPLLYAAGAAGAALVVTAAVLLVDLGGSDAPPGALPAPAPTSATAPAPTPSLPEGVGCTGADCGGMDPEDMGCGGPLATTVARTRIGAALVEVRHSAVCAAAWARISGGAPGDEVSVQAGTAIQVANVMEGAGSGAYTTMIPVASPDAARACAALSGGEDGCTGG